ncbi:PREDICTED: sodium/potassium/calcium exchanger 4-like [Dufourea novaeangliae]|uniref:sodium/potassium/calcium exchanger 4-like n=1 Tax=Dufourea novaeangliae TaxID=178035 RepID=UPI0007678EF3|nr:PREDICTED: sodium/potassium/calcium exchanger 4-like [Dufourea novaeangliae]
MNSRFPRCCVWIVVLTVCFPGICAFLKDSELFASNLSNIGSYEINPARSKLSRNDGEQPFGNTDTPAVCNSEKDDFPADLFTDEQRRHGALLLHAFLGLYCFLITAFVCHNYLLPALDCICESMNISTDIAGATFLAMASSLPEMFVNVIGTFLTKTDLGVGTVVGSAVFDTFATPACGALMALHAVPLQWRVLTRDCAVYIISVGALVIVIWDGRIVWYEAVMLLVILLVYLILLFCGPRMVRSCSNGVSSSTMKLPNGDENSSAQGSYKPYHIKNSNGDESTQQQNRTNDPETLVNLKESMKHEKPESLFLWPKERTTATKCWFLFTWPLKFLLFVTIPDARRERFRNWYPLTFVMCVVWIAISSYLVSWMVTVIGDTIGIPDSVMGFTFLAAGGNMPELASIVILARQGDGNMAMSNTLGANILDILLCLGLPWTIKCLTTGNDVVIQSGALAYSILSILGCIVILYAVIAFFKFHLNKKVGLICLLLYTIFLVFSILAELNVFLVVNVSTCD